MLCEYYKQTIIDLLWYIMEIASYYAADDEYIEDLYTEEDFKVFETVKDNVGLLRFKVCYNDPEVVDSKEFEKLKDCFVSLTKYQDLVDSLIKIADIEEKFEEFLTIILENKNKTKDDFITHLKFLVKRHAKYYDDIMI